MTAYLVVTRDNDGGYRLQLRDKLAATQPIAQSRKEAGLSEARKQARRLAGDQLQWRSGKDLGLQDYVVEATVVEVTGGTW